MNTNLDCIPCITSSFTKLIKSHLQSDVEQEDVMRKILNYLAEADYKQSPPVLGKDMHKIIREVLNNPDPYKEIKIKYNKMMMDQYSKFKSMIKAANDPFDMAMRLAIAGNVIDFGPKDQLDFMDTIKRVIHSKLIIDDSSVLREELIKAKSLMYIGDNCGEIVFDKLFLEELNFPNVHYVVRESPVLNDITMEDAKIVGIDKLAKVITTGDNSPGAVWETTSDEFKKVFNNADIIISKGQGNLEGLLGVNQNIYFLLVIKCERVAKILKSPMGEYIVKHQRIIK